MRLRLFSAGLILGLSLVCAGLLAPVPACAANPGPPAPDVVDAGFSLYAKAGAGLALDTWRKGGLAEADSGKVATQLSFFRQTDRTLGNYRAYEVVQSRRIGASSRIFYIAINYQRGAVYARFLVYQTDKDWVVQSMDFSLKPEAIMPWLALENPE